MEIFAIVGLLTSYFKYRNAKTEGTVDAQREKPAIEPYVQKPLPADAGRLERIAHWLGLEEK